MSDREWWLARRVEQLEEQVRRGKKKAEPREKVRECLEPGCKVLVRSPGHGRPRLYCCEDHRRKGRNRSNRRTRKERGE